MITAYLYFWIEALIFITLFVTVEILGRYLYKNYSDGSKDWVLDYSFGFAIASFVFTAINSFIGISSSVDFLGIFVPIVFTLSILGFIVFRILEKLEIIIL